MAKTIGEFNEWMQCLFDTQARFQEALMRMGKYDDTICFSDLKENEDGNMEYPSLPSDSVSLFSYHVQAMVEELGEVLKADKRWKTHRNKVYDKNEKLEELADVLISFVNMCLFSGFSCEEVVQATTKKMKENTERLVKESE